MKTNTIIRIIIWSLVIVVLVGILGSVMYGFRLDRASARSLTEVDRVILTTAPETEGIPNAAATVDVNIRKSPSMLSEAIGMLEAGEVVTIQTQEVIDGQSWSFIITPEQGWVVSDYLADVDFANETLPYIESDETALTTAPEAAAKAVNIRKTPSTKGECIGSLEIGETVTVTRTETVDGRSWSYITAPVQGWIASDYLMDETVYIPNSDPNDKNVFSAEEIQELEIQWVSGEILIQPGNTDQITVREDNVSDEKYAMVLQHKGDKLKIQFCEESVGTYFGVNTRSDLSKDLTITVPQDWVCESLDIECASATVEVNDMTIREVDFDGASGTCEFENCTVEEIDIDTASGDVRFIGSLDILDCDAASASIYAVLSNTPSRVDVDTMSGDLDITLPPDAGFTVTMDGASSDFSSEFETTMKNGNQVCGDGSCRINVDAMSGDVTIRKGEMYGPAPETDAPIAP